MKSVIILVSIVLFSSCQVLNRKQYDTIYVSKKVDKMIHNLNVMEDWLDYDFRNGRISEDIANNYYIVIENTRESLEQFKEKNK